MQHASDTHQEAVISALYEAATSPATWPRALALLAEWADAEALLLVDVDRGCRRLRLSHGHDPAYLDGYRREWLRDDPRLAPAAGLDARRHERRLAGFREWQATHGLGASFGDRMSDADGAATWLLVSTRDTDSQGRVAIRYGRVRGHLERALLLTRRHEALAQRNRVLETVVDDLSLGVLLLEADGGIEHANACGWRVLLREDALQMRDGRLRALREDDDLRLQALLADGETAPGAAATTGWMALPRRSGGPPYVLAVRGPDPAGAPRGQPAGRHVLIGDAAHMPLVRAADLCVIFDLTAREAQVCVRLLRGLSVDETAADLGISPRTARVYLQQVYDKVGVHRQTDLVRLLMCCPATAACSSDQSATMSAARGADPAACSSASLHAAGSSSAA